MTQYFIIHPISPQPRLIREAVKIVQQGGVIAFPTDSCYALGCKLANKGGLERMVAIGQLTEESPLALICLNLSELAQYATVNNTQFRQLKAAIAGHFTFILPATREVPRYTLHPKSKTVGLRFTQNNIVQALLSELGDPILAINLLLSDEPLPLCDPEEIRERLERSIDAIIDGGRTEAILPTVIDLSRSL